MTRRLTSAREIILETLNAEHKHWTPQEIYEAVRCKLPSINQSTVYRALEYLSNRGWISVSDMGLSTLVYETVGGEIHHHLVCQECEKVLTLEHECVQELFKKVAEESGFTIHTNHLILFGLCERCAQAKEAYDLA